MDSQFEWEQEEKLIDKIWIIFMQYFDQNLGRLASNCIAFTLYWFIVTWSFDLVLLLVIKDFTISHLVVFLQIFRFIFLVR